MASASRFAHLGHLIGQGLRPEQMPQALKEVGLRTDDLKGFLNYMTQPERISLVPTAMLSHWYQTTQEGIRFESDRGEFSYARELEAMNHRIAQELMGR